MSVAFFDLPDLGFRSARVTRYRLSRIDDSREGAIARVLARANDLANEPRWISGCRSRMRNASGKHETRVSLCAFVADPPLGASALERSCVRAHRAVRNSREIGDSRSEAAGAGHLLAWRVRVPRSHVADLSAAQRILLGEWQSITARNRPLERARLSRLTAGSNRIISAG